jgi:hypothetical protein
MRFFNIYGFIVRLMMEQRGCRKSEGTEEWVGTRAPSIDWTCMKI